MKILLTGATGYIGSYLTEYLSEEASNGVIPLYRKLPDYFRDWRGKFEGVECDVTKLDDLKEKVPEEIDCIIHLAAFNDVLCSRKPEQALIVNGIGTRNMLEVAEEKGCQSFIYFSTLQVYGKDLQGTITLDSPIKCVDDYAFTHCVAEGYCKMLSSLYDLNVSVVRPSNIFGCPVHPKIDRWTLVPATFCLSAYEKNEIRLKSSGKQNRDFVSLDFVSKCIRYLIEENKSGFNIYNLTSEKLFSIIEVAKLVQLSAKSILNMTEPSWQLR
jgi:UDP-glucose 4-epimerase